MRKRDIGDKVWKHKHDITGDDLIVVDEYEDQTYRLYIPGDYQRDEIDRDFVTVQSIREFLGLRQMSKMDELSARRAELLESIGSLKAQLKTVQNEIEGVKDIHDLIPDITAEGEAKLEALLVLIEKPEDSGFLKYWTDVRSVALDGKGNNAFGPYMMIPPREEDEGDTEA
jgi:hypothetical protein